MPVSSSDRPWRTLAFDWPVDRLRLEVEVVEPRLLTALEWVVLRVVDEFADAAPTLAEVAEELGLDRPEFLRDTLRDVVRLNALAPPAPGVPVHDLGDVAFTDTGRLLYRRGQIEATPATHAIVLDIDALTDEDLAPNDPAITDTPASGPPTREDVGLDRVRGFMRKFHRDILRGDAVVRACRVTDVERVARRIELACRIDRDGELVIDSPALGATARAVVRELPAEAIGLDVNADPVPRRTAREIRDFAAWQAQTTRTIPATDTATEACALIGRARREVALNAIWLTVGGVREALQAGLERGVHVVLAAGPEPVLDSERHADAWALCVATTAVRPVACALIVDGASGVVVEDVALRWCAATIPCTVVGGVEGSSAAEHRARLVESILDNLLDVSPGPRREADTPFDDWTVKAHLARLYLAPHEAHAHALRAAVDRRTSGLTRVILLRDLSRIGGALAPSLPKRVWDWRPTWDDALLDLLAGNDPSDADLQRLVDAAPSSVTPADFVDHFVDACASGVGGPQRRTLRRAQTLAARRWGPNSAATCPAWVRARDRNLAEVRLDALTIRDLVDDAAALLTPREAATWALAVLTRLPPPPSHDFNAWAAVAAPLRNLTGEAWAPHATTIWRAWIAASPDIDAALPVALQLLTVDIVVAPLLPPGASPSQWLALRRRIVAVRPTAAAAPLWATSVRAALPPLGAAYRVNSHGPIVRKLAGEVSDWPEGQAILAAWAAGIADAMRHADNLPALVFWFAELHGLAPALRGDLLPRARAAVQPHRHALRDARARDLPLWTRLADAWHTLGLRRPDLEVLAAPAAPPPAKKGRRR